ncbi:nucleotidyltransferase family protein [Tepidimonas taiwanensis]|uniref:Nucleotidyltransferase domain protein n=1 Tax=Tepidimonas taiwanensis TaxID=307486 RepID=A0A554X0A0_9BURK|nr:nucleotidyltransferase family protein [Tepidimonas taiwanensis]MDM7462748.1 nucleotidyltransferase family protein [Tepidimonas taiwanensis]TSE29226.1 Nucleotidyltransferase domain protein [Tepidimonas taiwanensis]UBQ04658.1 nucleotidyltransferase family protein [Tepidimonas taiwanensis]
MDPIVERQREALRALAQRHGVRSLKLFGSMARGDATSDSDVDLLIDPLPGTSALAIGAFLMETQELLGRKVDVVSVRALHPLLRERILQEAIPL